MLTLHKKLSDCYCRGLRIVRHHDPVQSARPRASPQRMDENTAKDEFLQQQPANGHRQSLFEEVTEPIQTYHRSRPRHLLHLHSVVEPVAKHHVLIVGNGAALYNSKLKPRLTRCPTRRSALESVAPASYKLGRHVRGELHQPPPSAVGGGGCRARTTSFSCGNPRKAAHACSDVSCIFFVDVYHCFLSMLPTTTSRAASIVPATLTEAYTAL